MRENEEHSELEKINRFEIDEFLLKLTTVERTDELQKAISTILAIGYDVKKVRVGNRIVLDWSKCYPVKVNDIERAIIDEEHILAVVPVEE